jgi:hypothetical protein
MIGAQRTPMLSGSVKREQPEDICPEDLFLPASGESSSAALSERSHALIAGVFCGASVAH